MGKKILVVDDEKKVLDFLWDTLSGEGYEVIKADNGNDAIDIAREQHPNLILLDLIMPGMNGSTVAEILENDTATKEIPLIFLTGLITKKEEDGCHTRGGKRFIAKPYSPKDLLEAVDKCLKP